MSTSNKKNHLVSVVIPCYNHEKYVQECIQSILDQDYQNIELIIIDDGSKDQSVAKIQEMLSACRSRFTRFEFRYRSNQGLTATLNEGLAWCAGIYVAFLASDDVLLANRFSSQVKEFILRKEKDSNLVCIYSGVEFIDEKGEIIRIKKGSGQFSGFKEVILRTEFLPTPTLLTLRENLVATGGYNPNYKIEDYYMRLKITEKGGKFYTMPDILVKYRQHDDNLSKKLDTILYGVQEILSEYKSHTLYKQALSMSMMIHAHSEQIISKRKSIKFILKAVDHYPQIIFSRSMLKLLAKMFYTPKR